MKIFFTIISILILSGCSKFLPPSYNDLVMEKADFRTCILQCERVAPYSAARICQSRCGYVYLGMEKEGITYAVDYDHNNP